jgi:hypothetical protein
LPFSRPASPVAASKGAFVAVRPLASDVDGMSEELAAFVQNGDRTVRAGINADDGWGGHVQIMPVGR